MSANGYLSDRVKTEPGRVLLKQPRSALIAFSLGILISFILPICGYFQHDKSEKFLLILSVAFMLIFLSSVIAYIRIWHSVSEDGMNFGRLIKPRGELIWTDVAEVSYRPRTFRVFTIRWFQIRTTSGDIVRVSDSFAQINRFAKLVLKNVPVISIEKEARAVLRATADGWTRTSGDKWLDPGLPRTSQKPILIVRAIAGYVVGVGLIPPCLALFFALSPRPEASFTRDFELRFVWPCYLISGFLTFFLLRLPRRIHFTFAMVALLFLTSTVIAYAAPYFYPQYLGKEIQLTKSILAQSFFVFGTVLTIAMDSISNARKLV